jgi:hypothetical protein
MSQMALARYIQRTSEVIRAGRLPHAIIVEAENASDALYYVVNCAKIILKTCQPEVHPDFFSIAPIGKINVIKIEIIRELIEYAQKTPHSADQKMIVIFDAHRLNKNAAEALLKTLEEPPTDTVLWLTTPSKYLLLPTIISRCALHRLPKNFTQILPNEYMIWLEQLELFLQKLAVNVKNINPFELYFLLEILSKNMENFENHGRGSETENTTIEDIYSPLLNAITEKIWHVFHKKIPAHCLEQIIKTVSEASTILSMNGSFLHVIENILLNLYQINCHISPKHKK